ncbi:MAG: hypothetical protein U5N56_04105 [Candidatus Marinimicrobia bacterium]|nr:hypothetical protein [Candidatus Neomarinimicrobiota bacterium]
MQHDLIVVDSLKGTDDLNVLFDVIYGRVIILQPLEKTDTIVIHYHYSDADVPRKMGLGVGRISTWFPEDQKKVPRCRMTVFPMSGPAVPFPGNLKVGSTGQSMLSGGLDLKISGELSPGVKNKRYYFR